jgi:hypothetical protein
MKLIIKYLIIFPILLISFSCDETVTDSTVYNGDIVGSWMLTGLTGTYTYVIDLPEDGYGQIWAADASFGIRIKWNYADAILGDNADNAMFWMPGAEFAVGDVSLYTVATYDLPTMQAAQFGLIGVFDDAPSSGSDATYKMKGTYPGIFYNYSLCSSAGSTAPMTDQGLYTWDQTSYNFAIKRDPSIAGSQVLPQFNDGTLTMTNDTTMNILFKDRDSHSTLYAEIMDSWDEGNHPATANGGNGENSGGDRTYMAFPPLIVDATTGGFAGTFDGTNGTPATSGYFYSIAAPLDLSAWGGYMTWYAFSFSGESQYLGAMAAAGAITISDADNNGAITSVDIAVYIMSNPTNTTQTGMPYSVIVSAGADGMPVITNDSDHDVDISGGAATLGAGGKLTFDVISDCAAPVDVTIDFNTTFTKCTTDNCTGDGYHVPLTWD